MFYKEFNKDFSIKNYTYDLIRSFYEKDKIQKFNCFGVRMHDQVTDKFSDKIGYWKDDKDKTICIYNGTTKTGLYYTKNPLNKNGAAMLACKMHKDLWARGLHKNKYKALVQINPCLFARDGNQDGFINDKEKYITDIIGANLHRASLIEKINIGKYSAGCQVIQKYVEYQKYIKEAYNANQTTYSYRLFHIMEL